ncbi:MAG TPA: histidine phosphatase family protein, partial [Myxococcaceae bacterium]
GVQAQVGPRVARLVLVRHGESTWNRDNRVQGQLDPPLSEEGHRQAGLLARRLARRSYEALYASDLARAIETAAPIASAIGLPIQPDTQLREIFLGEWEGLRADEISSRYPSEWAAWSAEPSWDVVPGGEGAAPFQVRVEGALDSILDRHPQGNVLVVTHGGVIQVALHRVVGRPSHGLFPFRISNTSISVIERREGRLVIGRVNDIAHLEAAPPDSTGPR